MVQKRSSRKAAHAPKDKVLHTRVPEHLEQQLKDRAEDLGLSVSGIVRNALLNTFSLVEGVVSDSANLALRRGDRTPARKPERRATSAPYGWQNLVLNVNAVCQQCNALLPRGSQGAIGIPATEPPAFLCQGCLDALQQDTRQRK